jgi:hypothetical protein
LQFRAGCLNELGRPAEAIAVLERVRTIHDASDADPVSRAVVKFELARALWALGRDRKRALALAEEARQVIAADPEDKAQAAAGVKSGSAEVAAWIAGKKP